MSSQRSLRALQSCLAVPIYIPPEEVNVGRALFHDFVHEQFGQVGLDDSAVIDDSDDIVREHEAMVQNAVNQADNIVAGVTNNVMFRAIGNNLRNLANEFAESPQRERVRQHADEVDLAQLTYDGFWTLLEEVFRHGVNVYNIVALFYFCSDILIRAVKVKLAAIGLNLFKWALKYISEQVCKWVYENGGWHNAIKQVITTQYVGYGAMFIVGFAFGWGIYKGFFS